MLNLQLLSLCEIMQQFLHANKLTAFLMKTNIRELHEHIKEIQINITLQYFKRLYFYFFRKSRYLICKREKVYYRKFHRVTFPPLYFVYWWLVWWSMHWGLVWWSLNVRHKLEQCSCALIFRAPWICPMSSFWLTFFSPLQ